MDKATNKKIRKSLEGFSPADFAELKKENQGVLQSTPDNQEAKDMLEVLAELETEAADELTAAPEEKKSSAAQVLAQRNADDREISKMVAGGLEHAQAVAALKHKKDFAKKHAEVQAAKEKAAKK